MYYSKSAHPLQQELEEAKDIRKDYTDYISYLETISNGNWRIFLAMDIPDKVIGFIIGSVSIDKDKVLETFGKIEDWYVEEKYRGQAIGRQLYDTLEDWFRSKGCQHVQSDTWAGNSSSIEAHEKMGFFVSGIQFSKKLG